MNNVELCFVHVMFGLKSVWFPYLPNPEQPELELELVKKLRDYLNGLQKEQGSLWIKGSGNHILPWDEILRFDDPGAVLSMALIYWKSIARQPSKDEMNFQWRKAQGLAAQLVQMNAFLTMYGMTI